MCSLLPIFFIIMDIVTTIRNFVEEECKKPTSKYGYEPFPCHFVPMVAFAQQLAAKLWGDREIIEISWWLHDIGSILYGRENHHLTWVEVAEKKLKELWYPRKKIEQIKNCIFHHRGSQPFEQLTLEEQIIVEADVMSTFNNLSGLFKAALVYENLSQEEARISVREKLERKWNQIHFEESRELIRPKYEAAMLLLQDITPHY